MNSICRSVKLVEAALFDPSASRLTLADELERISVSIWPPTNVSGLISPIAKMRRRVDELLLSTFLTLLISPSSPYRSARLIWPDKVTLAVSPPDATGHAGALGPIATVPGKLVASCGLRALLVSEGAAG